MKNFSVVIQSASLPNGAQNSSCGMEVPAGEALELVLTIGSGKSLAEKVEIT
jgi:hypothetical protein